MSTKTAMAALDAKIFAALDHVGLTDLATIGSVTIEGYFIDAFIEQGSGDELVAGSRPAFDCRQEGLPALSPDDEITIEGQGTFRYLRSEPEPSGRVILLLGTILDG